MKDFFQNQIALALILYLILGIGSLIIMQAGSKEVITLIITAAGSLVTGGAVGYNAGRNQRSTDTTSNVTETIKKEDKPNV